MDLRRGNRFEFKVKFADKSLYIYIYIYLYIYIYRDLIVLNIGFVTRGNPTINFSDGEKFF